MTLREARCKHSLMIARLIIHANELGYEAALAEGMDRKTKKDPTSDHMDGGTHDFGLGQDIDLYKDGKWLELTTEHLPLGLWWEEQGRIENLPLVWGGRFDEDPPGAGNGRDGNHYSFAWKGVR